MSDTKTHYPHIVRVILDQSQGLNVGITYVKLNGDKRTFLAKAVVPHSQLGRAKKPLGDTIMVYDILEEKPKQLLLSGIQSIRTNRKLYNLSNDRASNKGIKGNSNAILQQCVVA